jgi:DNA-directed RNA polymerase specialized sigma24 family protein
MVGLSINGKRVTRRIHNLVLTAFIGQRPRGMQACHFPDSDTGNNRLDNLRWDTASSNYNDRRHHGTSNSGERNGSAKIERKHAEAIRRLRKTGMTYRELGERFGVSTSNAQSICQGWTWKPYQN